MIRGTRCSEFFVRKNSEYFTAKDIFNKDGILLLGKGQKLSLKSLEKLEKHGISDLYEFSDRYDEQNQDPFLEKKQRQKFEKSLNEFKERIEVRNNNILVKPVKVLNFLIFESRKELW